MKNLKKKRRVQIVSIAFVALAADGLCIVMILRYGSSHID